MEYSQDQEILPRELPREVEKVLHKLVDVLSISNKNLKTLLSIYLIPLDESIIEKDNPEFKFLFQLISTLFDNRLYSENEINSIGINEEDLNELFDSLIFANKAPALSDLVLLMKIRFLIDLAIFGIDNFEAVLESFKREFRQIIIEIYAINDLPLPKRLNISLDAKDRAYYENVKLKNAEFLKKYYDDNEADEKLLKQIREIIKQRVNEECADADSKFYQRSLDLEQQRTDQVLASFVNYISLSITEFSKLKWDILPDEIVDEFLTIDLLRKIFELS